MSYDVDICSLLYTVLVETAHLSYPSEYGVLWIVYEVCLGFIPMLTFKQNFYYFCQTKQMYCF